MSNQPRMDATLSYESAKTRTRHWRFGSIVAVCAALGLALMCVKMLPEVNRRFTMLYQQRRLLNSSSPAVPAVTSEMTHQTTDGVPAGHLTLSLPQLSSWERFRAACSSPAPAESAPVYIHSISDRHGNQLLVVVQVEQGTYWYSPRLISDVLVPGSLTAYPTQAPIIARPFQFDFDLERFASFKFTVFSGQPDPADASHFTIDYDLNGQRHALDGYINEQDVLTIEKRKER